VADVLRAVVVAEGEAAGDALGEAAEAAPHALTDGLERLEAVRLEGPAWMPTQSAEQWSRATNTAAWPSPVRVVVRSVPQRVSTVAGTMVPSWARGPRGEPTREGASGSCARISRSTRRFEVRTPAWRSRAQTFLCPSPWKGLAASTPRIAATRSASGIGPTGPGRRGGACRAGARCR
jgi:hypothetical protein